MPKVSAKTVQVEVSQTQLTSREFVLVYHVTHITDCSLQVYAKNVARDIVLLMSKEERVLRKHVKHINESFSLQHVRSAHQTTFQTLIKQGHA